MRLFYRLLTVSSAVIATSCFTLMNSPSADAQGIRTRTMMRIFWQDRGTDKLSWADLTKGDKWAIKRGWIQGFPKLDPEKQGLGRMNRNSNGKLVVGMISRENSDSQSGWVAVDPGTFEEPHGNHTHWKYTGEPKVTAMNRDANEGNPGLIAVPSLPGTMQVNQLTLENDEDIRKHLQTGQFKVDRHWVLVTTGQGDQATLCMINSQSVPPSVVKLRIPVAEGLQLSTPETTLSMGERLAFLFQGRIDAAAEVQEQLTSVELDPNRDGDLSDARVRKTIPVGASQVDGWHSIAFDAYGRNAVFTEPRDGVLNVLSVQDLQILARFKVGGIPDRVIAVGAPEHFH
jgi:hypothetical protein